MRKRMAIRLISFCLGLAAVLGGCWIVQKNHTDYYRNRVELFYRESVDQLCSSLSDIDATLEKMLYTDGATQTARLAVELIGKAQSAKGALSRLPNAGELTTVNRFLSQVGNYALALSEKRRNSLPTAAADVPTGSLTQKEEQSLLTALKNVSGTISQTVQELSESYNNTVYWSQVLESELSGVAGDQGLADGILGVEEMLTDYPVLLYDGPYADHMEGPSRPLLDEAQLVSPEQAVSTAKVLAGAGTQLERRPDTVGVIESYVFGNDDCEVAVSRQGGYPVYYRRYRTVAEEKITQNQVRQYALNCLRELGFDNMSETYYYKTDGVSTCHFAYLDGATLCYADLIKVGVALDTGEIVLLETTGYLSNHTHRAIPTPQYTVKEAQSKLSPRLQVNAVGYAMIPLENGREAPCFEFLCTGENERKILLYLNTQTLSQEELFLLNEDINGTLVK